MSQIWDSSIEVGYYYCKFQLKKRGADLGRLISLSKKYKYYVFDGNENKDLKNSLGFSGVDLSNWGCSLSSGGGFWFWFFKPSVFHDIPFYSYFFVYHRVMVLEKFYGDSFKKVYYDLAIDFYEQKIGIKDISEKIRRYFLKCGEEAAAYWVEEKEPNI